MLYSLAPLTTLLALILFIFLPIFAYPRHHPPSSSPYPYVPYFPFPLPEVLVSASLWCFSYLLRDPIYSLSFLICTNLPSALPILLSTAIHTVTTTFIRLSALPILLISHHMIFPYPTWHDPAFGRVWWVALGWAFAEGVVGVKQGYNAIALYRDVLVTDINVSPSRYSAVGASPDQKFDSLAAEAAAGISGTSSSAAASSSSHLPPDFHVGYGERDLLLHPRAGENGRRELSIDLEQSLEIQIDRDLDQLTALKGREELEELYGIPAIVRVPVQRSVTVES